MQTSQILFRNIDNNSTTISEPLRADLWYGAENHIYTIAIHSSAFNGSVHIEGTILSDPQDIDWFSIGEPILFDNMGPASKSISFNGLYTWIRARIVGSSGYIDRVLINQ